MITAAVVLSLCLAVVIYTCTHSPMGYEGKNGFRYGRPSQDEFKNGEVE